MWFSVSSSSTLFMRSKDTRIDASPGVAAPERPVPDPRAVTGMRSASAKRRTSATSWVLSGQTTTAGVTASTVRHSSWV